jgi:DNA invertase Pin-like site-specific DNA recombinase
MRDKPSVRVRELQRALVRHGYSVGKAGIDGRFGPRTRIAVRRAQRAHHLKVDGVVGLRTRRALRTGVRRHAVSERRHGATKSHRRVAKGASTKHAATPAASEPAASKPAVSTPAVSAPPASTPAATSPPATPAVRLSTDKSHSGALILAPLAALIVGLFVFAYVRQRRRYAARIAAYHLRTAEMPSLEVTASQGQEAEAAEERPPAVAPDSPDDESSGLEPGAPVIGYVTERPVNGRAFERSPEREIERACNRSGWQLVDVVRDREDGRILERPGLSRALERITEGEAQGLVVSDARLLSRSVDFATFVRWFRDARAALIALDLGLDTSTPDGSRVATALITLNGWAGEWIASRTRRSLADIRPNGGADGRLAISERPAILERIAAMDASGMTPQEIADQLNDESVPTLFGTEKWWVSSVHAAMRYWRAGSATRLDRLPPTERRSAAC